MDSIKYFVYQKNVLVTISVFIALTFLLTAASANGQIFTQIFEGEIVNDGGSSASCSWGDYDNDGFVDLFVTNYGSSNFLYQNNGDGTFSKNYHSAPATDGGKSFGASWGDYDNDGNLDLYVANYNQENFLYQNNGDGIFIRVTTGDIVTEIENSWACSWADVNNDGFLDMFVSNFEANNSLYQNNGDGTFTKITAGAIVNDGGRSRGAGWCDYNNDGSVDLFVCNEGENNFLYLNNRNGTFTKITSGSIVNDGGNSYSSSWGDYDNDGFMDLYVTNSGERNFLYRNNGNGSFSRVYDDQLTRDRGSSYSSSWGDYDNDGDIDLVVANWNHVNFLYENNGNGSFTRITAERAVDYGANHYSCSFTDYDNDGALDLFFGVKWGADNKLFHNNGNENNWIQFKCTGTTSNASATGARIQVLATINGEPRWQVRYISAQSGYASQNSLTAAFGIGDATEIDSVVIDWPSGIHLKMTDVPINQIVDCKEPIIYVSMPTINVHTDEYVKIPVNIQLPPYCSFHSAELTMDGFQDYLDFIGVLTDSSLSGDAGWMVQANNSDSLVMWFAGAEGISGDGVLCWLNFYIPDQDSTLIPLNFKSAILDVDDIPVVVESGGINLLTKFFGDVDLNRRIQAYDAAMLLQYLVGTRDLNLEQRANANVSLDTTISALDATLILQYGVGIIDTLPFNGDVLTLLAEGDVQMSNSEINSGAVVEIPIVLNSGKNIMSFEGSIRYNPMHLSFSRMNWSKMSGNFMIDIHESDGRIQFAGASTSPKNVEQGIFAVLKFKARESFCSQQTEVVIEKLRWNEGEYKTRIASTVLTNLSALTGDSNKPTAYSLSRNFPNPFNPATKIEYSLRDAGFVELYVYNEIGHLVRRMVNTHQQHGSYSVTWDGKNDFGQSVASGVYIYTIKAGNNWQASRKMILIK